MLSLQQAWAQKENVPETFSVLDKQGNHSPLSSSFSSGRRGRRSSSSTKCTTPLAVRIRRRLDLTILRLALSSRSLRRMHRERNDIGNATGVVDLTIPEQSYTWPSTRRIVHHTAGIETIVFHTRLQNQIVKTRISPKRVVHVTSSI